jgi:nicotinate-nucleotide adenylyltransferase
VPPDAREVLLVGGQFDPPHPAHVALPTIARDRVAPGAWLVFVPSSRSPLKEGPRAGEANRVAMLRIAISGIERATIWTDEIHRAAPGAPAFWIDTLQRARTVLRPQTRVRFVIGADQAAQFHRWRSPREILAIAEPIVILRDPWRTPDDLARALSATGAWSESEVQAWKRRTIATPLMPESSTEIRELLARGDTAAIDPRILSYIRDHHLYGC